MNAPIERLDENFATTGAGDGLSWYDARRVRVEGKGWADTERFFDRFPARAREQVPAPVWDLSRHSAGIAVRFVTASPVIAVRWRSWGSRLAMTHMPATGGEWPGSLCAPGWAVAMGGDRPAWGNHRA